MRATARAGGLGDVVLQALDNVDVGSAFNAGVAIVAMAIALDRVTAAVGEGRHREPAEKARRRMIALAGLGAVVVLVVAAQLAGVDRWPASWTFSVAGPVNSAVGWIKSTVYSGVPVVGGTAPAADWFVRWVLNPLRSLLQDSPWWLVVAVAGAIGQLLGGLRVLVTAVVSLLVVGVLGVWGPSMDTLSQVIAATVVTLVVGVAVGIAMSFSARAYAIVRPLLDAMQTMPQFVYLIPVVALFAVGRTPGIAAAVIYALPAVIRLTESAIEGVSPAAVEAAVASGSTRWQLLRKVQLPLARPGLMLAVNQGLLLVLAVVVIGGLVGSGALGYMVVVGLSKAKLGEGLVAGVAIVCLGLMLDRITQGAGRAREGQRS